MQLMYKTFMALHNMVICKSLFLGPLWVPRYSHKWPEMVVERAKSNPELLCHSSHVCPQKHPLSCALLFYVQGHEQLVQGLSSKGGVGHWNTRENTVLSPGASEAFSFL